MTAPPNKITPANAGWPPQFRFRGSRHRPGVAELFRWADMLTRMAIICLSMVTASAGTPVSPDKRDGEVIEAVLRDLLADRKFGVRQVRTNDAVIVLHERTPAENGVEGLQDFRDLLNDSSVPADAVADLARRNRGINITGDLPEGVIAYYTNLAFSGQVVVTNVSARSYAYVGGSFEKSHPKGRAWAEMHLPGYSADGSGCVISGWVGPTSHGARLTALLYRVGGKWLVKRRVILYHA